LLCPAGAQAVHIRKQPAAQSRIMLSGSVGRATGQVKSSSAPATAAVPNVEIESGSPVVLLTPL